MVRSHQTSDVRVHIGESRDSGFDAEPVIGPARGRTRWHRPGMTVQLLPHHARDEPGLAPRRLDFLFQEAVGGFSGISRPRIGPGPALVVAGAGRLALIVAVAAFQFETAIIAAGPVDRGLDRAIARFDHAGAAHAGDAAIVLGARRHVALEPADRAAGDVGRVVEAPGPAPPVALAYQRAIRRIARLHR